MLSGLVHHGIVIVPPWTDRQTQLKTLPSLLRTWSVVFDFAKCKVIIFFVSSEKVTLISKDESEESRVTKSEATEFIAKEIATKDEPESEPSGVDAEDLLDEM